VTAERLLAYDAIDRRRRRAERKGLARLGDPLVAAILAGLAVAALLHAVARFGGAGEARAWWLVIALVGVAAIVMRAPWMIYWRPEASLLARLPIPGAALHALTFRRALRTAAGVAWMLAAAATPLLVTDGGATWGRAAGAAALACLASALVAPAAATAGGALVASDKAMRAVQSVSGELGGGPNVVWLSLIPSAGGFGVAAALYLSAPWIAAGRLAPDLLAVPAIAAGGAIVVHLAGRALAARWLSTATREVAALDAVKLAHVELSTARGVEAAWGAVAGKRGRMIYRKDVALGRRRYPAYYVMSGILLIAAWAFALFADEPTRTRAPLTIAAAMTAYTWIFSRRLRTPPIEHPRLLATLPLDPAAVARAKGAYVAWRFVFVAIALAALLIRR
jgi:hypothetical protein